MDVRDTPLEPLGYVQLTAIDTVTGFSAAQIPRRARAVLLSCEAQAVRWRDDIHLGGSEPTATVGQLLDVGDNFMYAGKVSKLRFIGAVAGAKLNASFYA